MRQMSGSMKLVALIESHAEAIARQWAKDVRRNPRTPSYHNMPEEAVVPIAMRFYDHFRQMFYAEKPAEASREYFRRYAEEVYRRGIPISEALYALIMMRRHIWLYAEFQTIFISAVEQKQAVDSLVRTILMFDYAVLFISERYQELIREDIDRRVGPVGALGMETAAAGGGGAVKAVAMAIMVIGAAAVAVYFHRVLQTDVIFTHLFYIPVVLASLWWGRKGVSVPLFLGIFLLGSHLVFLKGVPITDDLIRAAMFVVIGGVVAFLREGLARARDIYGQK
ncbi:MAG TPA: hypothetical protein PLA76_09625 [Syntrophales bacterium]|nr:hypothetical protein [Syntrophales bacterium]